MKKLLLLALAGVSLNAAVGEEIGCVTTAWKLIGAAITGSASMPSTIPRFPASPATSARPKLAASRAASARPKDPRLLACRQIGPISLPAKLAKDEIVFSEGTSLLFKETSIHRSFDAKRQVSTWRSAAS